MAYITCNQSAISVLTLDMRLTRSLRECTAWFGWRFACWDRCHVSRLHERACDIKGGEMDVSAEEERQAYQHSWVFSSL